MSCSSKQRENSPAAGSARWRAAALLAATAWIFLASLARGGEIVVVLSSNDSHYASTRDGLASTLEDRKKDIRSVTLKEVVDQGVSVAVGSGAEIVVAVGTPAAKYLHANAPKGAPTVFCMVADPDDAQLTQGQAMGGVTTDVPIADQFALIAQALPNAKVVGMLYQSNTPRGQRLLKNAQNALPKDWRLQAIAVDQCESVAAAIDNLLKSQVDCVWTSIDAGVYNAQTAPALLLEALRAKVPVFGFSPQFVKSGALIGIGIDPAAQGQQVGALVRKILEHSAGPSADQIQPPQFQIAVNQIVGDQIGVEIPAALVGRATYVVKGDK